MFLYSIYFSRVQDVLTSVTSLSIDCSIYQRKVLQLVESLVRTQIREKCISFSTEEVDPTCDLVTARHAIADLAQFLKADVDDSFVCR